VASTTSIEQLFDHTRSATERANLRRDESAALIAATRERLDQSADLLHPAVDGAEPQADAPGFSDSLLPMVIRD
jgi:hypothetical protein